MEGHSGQKCNLIATCISLDRICVPLDRTFLPFDRTSILFDRTFIPLDRIFLPFDRTFIPLDRTFLQFDRTSIILSLAIWHWFIPLWYFNLSVPPWKQHSIGSWLSFSRSHHLVSGEARKAKPRSRVSVETYDLWLHDVQLKIESHVEPRRWCR